MKSVDIICPYCGKRHQTRNIREDATNSTNCTCSGCRKRFKVIITNGSMSITKL